MSDADRHSSSWTGWPNKRRSSNCIAPSYAARPLLGTDLSAKSARCSVKQIDNALAVGLYLFG